MATKRRFTSRPSQQYLKAVDELLILLHQEGGDSVNRAFAEISTESRLKSWKQKYKFSSGHPCLNRLQGKRCDGMNPLSCRPPGADHTSLLFQLGKPVSFISQPYGLGWSTLKELVELCSKRGLEASIDASTSWHFPGRTLLVDITRPTRSV